MIPITDKAECKCIKTYIFNRTKCFDGVIFKKGECYIVDLGTKENSDLLAVIHPEKNIHIGMSKQRFVEHFIFINPKI